MKKLIEKVKRDGWGSIPQAVVWWSKVLLKNIPRQLIFRNRLLIRLFPLQEPPILLLSYPRSGSSWVGDILATSDEIAYLFEPITLQIQEYRGGPALVDLSDEKTLQAYRQYSQEAFMGVPSKKPLSPEKLNDFSPFGRRRRRLLVKEVNPRAAGFYGQHYRPFFLFLLRHPAAVALSFWEMGWLAAPDLQLEATNFEGDSWEKFGFSYGMTMKNALDSIKDSGSPFHIIYYEILARDPYNEFKKLFDDVSISAPRNFSEVIDEYCFMGDSIQGYETRRISKKMIAKWKDQLSPDRIAKIRHGFFESGFDFYRSDLDWDLTSFNGEK